LQAVVKTRKTELLFLALFIRLLKPGGRAAVIVPEGVLFGASNAHRTLRKILVDEQKLDAVISLPSGVFRPYAGGSTAVLVFTKTDSGGTDYLSGIAEALHVVMTGKPTSEEGMAELFDMTGVSAVARDEWNGVVPIAPDVESNRRLHLRILRALQLDRLTATIRRMSLKELEASRDLLRSFAPVLITTGDVARWATGLPDAFGLAAVARLIRGSGNPLDYDLFVGRFAPVMFVFQHEIPGFQLRVDDFVRSGPQLEAQASLIRTLPTNLRSTGGLSKLKRRSEEEQQRLIREWAARYPDQAAVSRMDTTLL
jgi:hypothetical protein